MGASPAANFHFPASSLARYNSRCLMGNNHLWLETGGAEETRALGARVANLLCVGAPQGAGASVLALAGDLGAGKTTFTQGLAHGLGIDAPVTSPTFVLINRYVSAGGRVLQHADCYRLSNAPAEMWDIGLDDLFSGDDVLVIEWADRIPGLLPEDYLDIVFEYIDENRRRIGFTAHGARYSGFLEQVEQELNDRSGASSAHHAP
jgi:tRNA threonylcarbamoyladenosine biosynthesis protein TsaE